MNDVLSKRKEVYAQAFETAHPLDDLILPSDVLEGAGRWGDISDERLTQEVSECLTVARQENQHNGAIRDLAVTMWRADLPRAPMEDLVFETEEEAVKNGYHPNSMTYMECEEILFEMDIPTDARQEAWEVVSAGIFDKTHPRRSKGDSL